jgi:hypothetical protein
MPEGLQDILRFASMYVVGWLLAGMINKLFPNRLEQLATFLHKFHRVPLILGIVGSTAAAVFLYWIDFPIMAVFFGLLTAYAITVFFAYGNSEGLKK